MLICWAKSPGSVMVNPLKSPVTDQVVSSEPVSLSNSWKAVSNDEQCNGIVWNGPVVNQGGLVVELDTGAKYYVFTGSVTETTLSTRVQSQHYIEKLYVWQFYLESINVKSPKE